MAQAGIDTRVLETRGNIYLTTRSSEKIVFKGAPDDVDANTSNYGYIDCRMPIKFNGVPTCKVGGTLTLPAHPCNGMFFFARECRIIGNGHALRNWNNNNDIFGEHGSVDIGQDSFFIVYSSDIKKWIAYLCN
jgi:hypothetical protein